MKRSLSPPPAAVKQQRRKQDVPITNFFKPAANSASSSSASTASPLLTTKWIPTTPRSTLLHLKAYFQQQQQQQQQQQEHDHSTDAAPAKSRLKIAAFDLDGTLIRPRSSGVFPKDANDWQWAFPAVPHTLISLHQSGHRIVIYTNQSGLLRSEKRMQDFRAKVQQVTRQLAVPLDLLAALADDKFRKPRTGMHDFYLSLANNENPRQSETEVAAPAEVDHEHSFYVGDAAGRPHAWQPGRKKDHSVADRKFALNLAMRFQTPEAFFGKEMEGPFDIGFDPHSLRRSDNHATAGDDNDDDPHGHLFSDLDESGGQEMIIMVGRPASGKSHFVQSRLFNYIRVNQDTLRTVEKCLKVTKESLGQGKSVVIDNTNATRQIRKRFLALAKDAGVPVRCFMMNVSKDHALHNNTFREIIGEKEAVPKIAFHSFDSKFEEPSMEEGFQSIATIEFIPKFKHLSHEEEYFKHLN